MRVVVVGGGVAGLGSALVLARHGHEVEVIERDDTPMPDSADEAFEWDRRGAPQVRHSHAFLARMVGLMRREYPELYAELLAQGATEMRFGSDLPPTMTDFVPQPDDEELVMLACRRTTFEWVLRRVAIDDGRVRFRTGSAAVGVVLADHPLPGSMVPHVRGVRLDDGTEATGDLTIVATGRRSALSEWLDVAGIGEIAEEIEDTGIVYLSRFYRLRQGAEYPTRTGPIGGDLGYLKYGVFVGDNRTFSVTLATPTADDELRRLLAEPATFDRCARLLVATAPYLDGRAEPLTDHVHVMAGLLNRWRDYMPGGRPLVTGLLPVGDAVLCTNPLYGRGCSIAFWGAHLVSEALLAHPDDLGAVAVAYDAALRDQIVPWYRSGVEQDAEARRVAAALLAGEDPDGDGSDPRTFMRSVFREGLLPALRSDAVVLRAFVRSLNLLSTPDALFTDPDVGGRVLSIWQQRESRQPEPALGPRSRADLLTALPRS